MTDKAEGTPVRDTTYFDEAAFKALFKWRTVPEPMYKIPPGQEDEYEGWTLHAPDHMKLLEGYSHLRMASGWELRAYQFYQYGNGNCVVFAWPATKPLPHPREILPRSCDQLWPLPLPDGAVQDFMRVVEGDGSVASYMQASMFRRDACELGAYWHGADWSDHDLLFFDPLAKRLPNRKVGLRDPGLVKPSVWKVDYNYPKRFGPGVRKLGGIVYVIFQTFSGLGRNAMYHHRDDFTGPGMSFQSTEAVVATAPGGFVH